MQRFPFPNNFSSSFMSCSNCLVLQQEINNLKSEILLNLNKNRIPEPSQVSSVDLPPSYSVTPTSESVNLRDPENSSITLVHGFRQEFGEKYAMQFKLYNFSSSHHSGAVFTGQGSDVDRGHYDIRGSWQDSSNCTIVLQFKEITTEYKGVVDWKASSITGTFCMPPWTITGGDPFKFSFFSL